MSYFKLKIPKHFDTSNSNLKINLSCKQYTNIRHFLNSINYTI